MPDQVRHDERLASTTIGQSLDHDRFCLIRHCEERSDEAIQRVAEADLDCFASLAMTQLNQPEAIML